MTSIIKQIHILNCMLRVYLLQLFTFQRWFLKVFHQFCPLTFFMRWQAWDMVTRLSLRMPTFHQPPFAMVKRVLVWSELTDILSPTSLRPSSSSCPWTPTSFPRSGSWTWSTEIRTLGWESLQFGQHTSKLSIKPKIEKYQ